MGSVEDLFGGFYRPWVNEGSRKSGCINAGPGRQYFSYTDFLIAWVDSLSFLLLW